MDKANSPVWMPYTQMKTAPEPFKVNSGKGSWLYLENGEKILDCISSWWVNIHGHACPEIAEAIYRQARELEQVISAGFTHEPAEKLARLLLTKLPDNLKRVFYSDNGSTAVEVALKMAFQYWKNKGIQTRTSFLAFEGAYHGDTFGAMSSGSRSVFNDPFNELLFDVDRVPFPATWMDDSEVLKKESDALLSLEKLLEKKIGKYSAMIVEPLVQGASGMNMCRPEFMKKLQDILKKHDVLMIYDEVMTGFGRLGEWFACKKSGTEPDIICLSKGITGGFLPLAVTVASEEVYDSFYDDDAAKALYHGHSYTANPLGCAAAVASFGLLSENENSFRRIENIHKERMARLGIYENLTKFRICGTIAAVDFSGDSGYLSSIGPKLKSFFTEKGFLLRPLGNVVYILPPYCISEEEICMIYEIIAKAAETALI